MMMSAKEKGNKGIRRERECMCVWGGCWRREDVCNFRLGGQGRPWWSVRFERRSEESGIVRHVDN